jgi:hypothetical protein
MKKIFITISIILLFVSNARYADAGQFRLGDCQELVCHKVVTSPKTDTATVVVWQDDEQIIKTYTFELEALDINPIVRRGSISQKDLIRQSGSPFSTLNNTPPQPDPCVSGGCSSSVSSTYETATEIITVTITFTFYNGELIDVGISQTRRLKPDDDFVKEK